MVTTDCVEPVQQLRRVRCLTNSNPTPIIDKDGVKP